MLTQKKIFKVNKNLRYNRLCINKRMWWETDRHSHFQYFFFQVKKISNIFFFILDSAGEVHYSESTTTTGETVISVNDLKNGQQPTDAQRHSFSKGFNPFNFLKSTVKVQNRVGPADVCVSNVVATTTQQGKCIAEPIYAQVQKAFRSNGQSSPGVFQVGCVFMQLRLWLARHRIAWLIQWLIRFHIRYCVEDTIIEWFFLIEATANFDMYRAFVYFWKIMTVSHTYLQRPPSTGVDK